MQHKKVFIALSIFSLVAFLFLFKARIPGLAATKTTNIFGNSLVPANQTILIGDQILFENEDFVPHVLEIRRATDSGLIHTENFVAKTADTKDTYSRTFGVAGNFNLILDTNVATGSVTVLQSSPSQTASASPTVTASPTISPTASATATPSPTLSPTPTVSPTSSSTPTVTASPTASPTVEPTATASPTPTETPSASPTATPTNSPTPTSSPTPTVSPTASPTVAPTVTASPTPAVSPSVSPTASPTQTASPSPTVTPTTAPTSSPSPTILPVPTVLPAFAVFRPTTCTSQIYANNTQILTDKLTPVYLIRGYWSVTSIASINNGLSVSGLLYQTQKINLLFGGNAFFGGNKVTAAHEQVTFVGNDLPDVLVKAKNSWCAR